MFRRNSETVELLREIADNTERTADATTDLLSTLEEMRDVQHQDAIRRG